MEKLKIHEYFLETIQGEGFWSGCPADFIRLWGCPVGCSFCDTGYSQQDNNGKSIPYELKSIDSLVDAMRSPLTVITGGEPMIHKELPSLVSALIERDRKVSIETSGSAWQEVDQEAWITLSPKEHKSPRFPVLENVWNRANEIKIVIEDGTETNHYRENLLQKSCPIYLQPEWSMRERTIPTTIALLKANPTYRLSLQTHKIIGVS